MSVTLFDNVIPLFAGMYPQQCGMLGTCAPQFVVEGNGDVYPCDFYVLDRFRLGNIRTDSLEDMATCDALRAFLDEPRRACSMCATCPFERICHKNCKRLNTCLLYTSKPGLIEPSPVGSFYQPGSCLLFTVTRPVDARYAIKRSFYTPFS